MERNEILQLLAEGKITAVEAIDLLDKAGTDAAPVSNLKASEPAPDISVDEFKAASKSPAAVEPDPFKIKISEDDLSPNKANGEKPRWLKIRVRNMETGRNKVSVSLPIGLVSFGLGVARRFGAEFDDDHDIDQIWQAIKEGEHGMLVDVEDEEDNEHVQIFLA